VSERIDGPATSDSGEDWLTTYADFLTLLTCFFVLMYSVSELDQGKFEEVSKKIVEELTGEKQALPFQDMLNRLDELRLKNGAGEETEVASSRRGLTFEFQSTRMFGVGSSEILPEAVPLLDRVAQLLAFMGMDSYRIDVEGHTDDSPTHSGDFATNWELSAARATAVVRFLIERGVAAERLSAVGYADTQPKKPNRDEGGQPIEANQAENRRIVIRIER